MNRFNLTAIAALILAIPAHAQFTAGDIYMHTHDDPDWNKCIVRIDPVTGDKSLVYDIPGVQISAQLSYDPCRDRLMLSENEFPNSFRLIDSTGVATALDYTWPGFVVDLYAPNGAGRIYVVDFGPGRWGYLDQPGQMQDLLDTSGQPLVFNQLFTGRNDLIYDATTNSLFLTVLDNPATTIYRLPLNADGTTLAGPIENVTYNAFADGTDDPYGMSAGPNGTLFIKIDTNSNADGVRLFTCDPATLACQDFATIGHLGVAGNTAGSYNSVHAYAATLDTGNDVIRTFVQSDQVQEGTILATNVSGPGGSGEQAELIVIGDTVNGPVGSGNCCPGDTDNSGAVDINDLLGLLGAWGSADPTYDIAPPGGDGIVDIQDLLVMLGNWGPC